MSIDVTRDGAVAIVTVNRPEALNALNLETIQELRSALQAVATDDSVRAVVLTGAGEKAFIAGADIKYMSTLTVLEARAWGALGHACASLLESMPKPTIAAHKGFATFATPRRRRSSASRRSTSASCPAGAARSACRASSAWASPRS